MAMGTTTVAVVMLLPAGHAAAQAPDVAAWWSADNLGDPLPVPPAPPDVPSGDLYVSGSNAGPAGLLGNAPTTTQAVAGLGFDLAKGALVEGLTLQIDGTAPPTESVIACKATETFTSDENGPWSQVPPYDANSCVPSELKGTSVVFAEAGKLATPDALRVLILPGPLDRLVFKQPTNGALAVSSGGSVGAAAPPIGAGTGTTPAASGGKVTAPTSGSTGAGGSGGVVPPVGNLPATESTGAAAAQPPVVATPGTTPTAAHPVTTTDTGMSTKNRRLIGLLIIAAEVVGYVLLRRVPAREAAPVAGSASAGGRLRPPDRHSSGIHSAQSGGVGRFRRDRQGAVPHL